jgi:hypothetical protein
MILPNGNQLLEDGSVFNPVDRQLTKATPGNKDKVAARLQQIQNSQTQFVENLKPVDTGLNNLEENNKLAASNQTIHFEYIFTGHNVDIQDFQMKMDSGIAFLQTLTIQSTMSDQSDTINNNTSSGTSRGSAGNVTKLNKLDKTRSNSILFYNPQSRDVYARHTKNTEATLAYRSQLSTLAALNNINLVLNITGNPNLISGTDPAIKTSDGNTRWNNVPQYCTVDIKYPDGDFPDGIYSFNQFWYTGLYRILQIENVFSDGLFTQNLTLVSLIVGEPYSQTSNDAKDCFSAPNITIGPRNVAVDTTSNINISNNNVTVIGANTFQTSNDQTNFLLGSSLDVSKQTIAQRMKTYNNTGSN